MYARVDTFWVEACRTTEEYDFELTAVDLYIGDYAGIGHPAVFIGYRIDGTGSFLDFDIVQSEGGGALDVRGIRGIDHGNVGLPADEPGVVISAVYSGDDPNCWDAASHCRRTGLGVRLLIAPVGGVTDRPGPLSSTRSLTTL